MVYAAYKEGQGGHSETNWRSRLSLANARLYVLRRMFPDVFDWKERLHKQQVQTKRKARAAKSGS